MEKTDQKFQIERLLFFSDAVMAIAMTLLIIEIKPPHISGLTNHEALESMRSLIPKFIAFFISFFVIAIYWRAHHHLFGFVNKYTDKLIWLNILFLLSIVLMPFSSAFYSENFDVHIPYFVYCSNIVIAGFLNCWLVRYISDTKDIISSVAGNILWRRYFTYRSLVAPSVFMISLFISIYSFNLSRVIFIVIFPLLYLLKVKHRMVGK